LKPKKPPKIIEQQPELLEEQPDLLEELAATLRVALVAVSAAVTRTRGSEPAIVKQAVALVTEMRKVDSARAKRSGELSVAQIVAWLRLQPAEVVGQLTRELHTLANPRGVLG